LFFEKKNFKYGLECLNLQCKMKKCWRYEKLDIIVINIVLGWLLGVEAGGVDWWRQLC